MITMQQQMENQMNKTVAEFFAGIGLVGMGLARRGWSVAYANDHDSQKHEIYTPNFPGHKLDKRDIREVNSSDVPTVTLATASFPCTDLSLAGAMAGLMAGKQSSMFWEFTRILEEMKKEQRLPPLVMLENVTAFLTSHKGEDFRAAMLELNRLGYTVDAVVLDAAWFVPQSRQRVFIIGVQRDLLEKNVASPDLLHMSDALRPKALTSFIALNQEISWNIQPLPLPDLSKRQQLKDVIEDIPESDEAWWSEDRCTYFYNQLSDRHKLVVDSMKLKREWSYGTAFRRMRNGKSTAEIRTDGLAGCLRTPKGGSARQILVRAGHGQMNVRLLSARECARLMGVADDFILNVPLNQALFAFGDAVCVDAVAWIAQNYLDMVQP